MSKDEGQWEKHKVKTLPGKITEHILLAAISKHVKYEKAISTAQHGFAKGMLSVANLTAPCVKMPGILSAMEAFVTEKKMSKNPNCL